MDKIYWYVPEVTLVTDDGERYAAMTVIVPVELGVDLLGKQFAVALEDVSDIEL